MRLKVTGITVVILNLIALWYPLTISAQAPVPCDNEYTVQASDWLKKIAEKYLGDALAYEQIVTATNSQTDDRFATIEDPNQIEAGWLLCIPAASKKKRGICGQPRANRSHLALEPNPDEQ